MVHRLLSERLIAPLSVPSAEPQRSTLIEAWKEILLKEEYGTPLPPPDTLFFDEKEPEKQDRNFCAGFALRYQVIACGTLCGRSFSFPFTVVLPKTEGKHPFFVCNNFQAELPNKYAPVEELIERGFGLLHDCYKDVTSDDGDFTNGIAGCLYPDGIRPTKDAPGKLAMWAWANMRLMDYALTLSCLDGAKGTVIGHSRLGKTALLTGLLDDRFAAIASNNAGCSGDALTRGKEGEHISNITTNFPYWFCENYKKYTDHSRLTFDQHLLLAALAPRLVMIGAAEEDIWADPNAQFLSCVAASAAWESYGVKGFVSPDRLPTAGDDFREGALCYHLRTGAHYLSRRDWNIYMDILSEKL